MEDIAEKAEYQDADQRSDHRSSSAHEACAANNNGCNGIELEPHAGIRFPLPILCDIENTGECGQVSRNGIDGDLNTPYRDTCQTSSFLVAADGVNIAPELCKLQDHPKQDDYAGKDNTRERG